MFNSPMLNRSMPLSKLALCLTVSCKLAQAQVAPGTAAPIDCNMLLTAVTQIQPQNLSRILPSNRIDLELALLIASSERQFADRISFWLGGFPGYRNYPVARVLAFCRNEIENYQRHIQRFTTQHFQQLLDSQNLTHQTFQQISQELKTLLLQSYQPGERENFFSRYADTIRRYLEGAYTRLGYLLVGTRWRPWHTQAETQIHFESWTPNWSSGLGAELPAAIELSSGRVGVRWWELSFDNLLFWIFHEMAHRVTFLPTQSALERERLSWRETLDWIDQRLQQNQPVPDEFRRFWQITRTPQDFENWIRGLVR